MQSLDLPDGFADAGAPLNVRFDWSKSSLSLPMRKGLEVDVLAATEELLKQCGGSKVEVVGVVATPRDLQSCISLRVYGLEPRELSTIVRTISDSSGINS